MKTADPELMRAINRLNVLDTIRRHGPISRVEISERTQLSTTTVSAITASLLDDGLILPRHEGDIRNEAARGRPRAARCEETRIRLPRPAASVRRHVSSEEGDTPWHSPVKP